MGKSNRFTSEVLPAVFARLDQVFPEFGWRRRGTGWIATNQEFSHARFGVRADRIVSTEQFGYLIHGSGNEHWLAYINGGSFPSGDEWYTLASELAARVGMAPFAQQREVSVWQRVLSAAQAQLASEQGRRGRDYCISRKLEWSTLGLGFVVHLDALLQDAGLSKNEARRLRVLTSRPGEDWWTGRLIGGVTTAYGEVVGIWGRALEGCTGDKYLVSGVGGPGVHGRVVGRRAIIVEGWIDALRVRSVSTDAVIVAGGTQLTDDVLALAQDAEEVFIGFDGDAPGDAGRRAAVRRLIAWRGPPTNIIGGLGPAEDLDIALREGGAERWESLISGATSWLQYAARQELSGRVSETLALRRVGALCRAASLSWPIEVAVTLREVSAKHLLDERFLLRVLENVSCETISQKKSTSSGNH